LADTEEVIAVTDETLKDTKKGKEEMVKGSSEVVEGTRGASVRTGDPLVMAKKRAIIMATRVSCILAAV